METLFLWLLLNSSMITSWQFSILIPFFIIEDERFMIIIYVYANLHKICLNGYIALPK